MTNIAELQPALITYDSKDEPVVIPVAELRVIARGLHDATSEQVEGLANYVLKTVEGKQ